MVIEPHYQPDLPEHIADPYPHYQELRRRAPIHFSEHTGAWVFTRSADIVRLLRDRRFSSAYFHRWIGTLAEPARAQFGDVSRLMSTVNFSDPPAHTRLRALYGDAFTPHAVAGLRPRIEELTHQLIDAVIDDGRMDFIAAVAEPLPARIAAEMLGMPVADIPRVKAWFGAIFALLARADLVSVFRARTAAAEMTEYLRALIDQRRRWPRDDLTSAIVARAARDEAVSADELLAAFVPLLPGGLEIQSHLGNALLALLRHPDQLRRLQHDQALVEPAVEELLRYDTSVTQTQTRVATGDVEISGLRIEAGQIVSGVLAAANRDPALLPDPDRLDVGRRGAHHLTFGWGAHYCLGAALTRLEEQVVLHTVVDRLADLRLEPAPLVWTNVNNRGLQALPVSFRRRSEARH